jgi:hypothetical protein
MTLAGIFVAEETEEVLRTLIEHEMGIMRGYVKGSGTYIDVQSAGANILSALPGIPEAGRSAVYGQYSVLKVECDNLARERGELK